MTPADLHGDPHGDPGGDPGEGSCRCHRHIQTGHLKTKQDMFWRKSGLSNRISSRSH